MSEKKTKPLWPIWSGIIVFALVITVFVVDWERYPTADEMERYLEASNIDKVEVEVVKMEEQNDEYARAMVYLLEYKYESGRIEKQAYTVRYSDRKPVFPWHDYYAGMYPNEAE